MQKRDETLERIVEIILYQLKPGTGREFHRIMKEISAPLHRKVGLEILIFRNSLRNEDTYILIRAFDSLTQMAALQHSFYNGADWIDGPRSEILDRIKSSAKSVLPINEAAIDTLKSS